MKWFQVDSDTPHDPKIKAVRRKLGTEGIGGLFLLWCHVADHGGGQPGWSVDSSGHPMPIDDLIEATGLDEVKFAELIRICVENGHVQKREWDKKKIVVIPAMATRADTYTKRAGKKSVRSSAEQSAKSVPLQHNTTQHNTTQHNTTHTKSVATKRGESLFPAEAIAPEGHDQQQPPVAPGLRLTPNAEKARFETFWAAFPKKVGKDAAGKVWQKKNPPIEAILAALSWQVRQEAWTKDSGQFIPNPATYLNQARWLDQPTSAAAAPRRVNGCFHKPPCSNEVAHTKLKLAEADVEVSA